MSEWNADTVATVLEKTVLLVVALVRKLKTPDKVLKVISDLTHATKEAEDELLARVRALYGRED